MINMIYKENAMINMTYKENAMINRLWLQGKDAQVRRELDVPWFFIHAVMLY